MSQLGEEDLVYDYLFTSQGESRFAPGMDVFAIPSLISSHLELSRNIPVLLLLQLSWLINSIFYAPAYKGLAF